MMDCRFAKHLVAAGAALVLTLASAPAALADATERPPQPKLVVAGCEITLNLEATHNCLEKALDRARRDAERHGKELIEKQVKAVQAELDKAEQQLAAAKKELESTQKSIEKEVARAVAKERLNFEKAKRTADNFLATNWGTEISETLATHAPLFACLQKEPGFDFVAMSNAFAKDPGAFVETQVRHAIAGVRTQWATVMKTELAQIASGRVPPKPAAAFASSADKLARLAQPVPGARCIFTHVTPLVQAHIDQALRDIVPVLEKEMRTILNEQILPEVQKGIAAQLREIFKVVTVPRPPAGPGAPSLESQLPFVKGLVPTEEEMRGIIRKVLLDRRFKQLERLLPAVDQLRMVAVDTRSTNAILLQAQRAVLTAIEPTPDWDRFYLQIGVEVVRKIGHKYLDSDETGHGGYLLNNAVSLLNVGEGTIELITEALCGLIPEVGAAACALFEEAINVSWNQGAIPQIEAAASAVIHGVWNDAMNRVRKQVDDGRPIAQLMGKSGLTQIDALIGSLPHEAMLKKWATDESFADEKKLHDLFTAIGTLATAATTR